MQADCSDFKQSGVLLQESKQAKRCFEVHEECSQTRGAEWAAKEPHRFNEAEYLRYSFSSPQTL